VKSKQDEKTSLNSGTKDEAKSQLQSYTGIEIQNGTFGWEADRAPVLQNININIPPAKFTMIVGPVASGKSTLLKAILGEVPDSKGNVFVDSTPISFCDQEPWITNGTVQGNILGIANFDQAWYKRVIHGCLLEDDINHWPQGDQFNVGASGMNLSGGQKMRVVCQPSNKSS
jgi:ATP-binding cassette subfamily C (CFTR/MRP) protein 1